MVGVVGGALLGVCQSPLARGASNWKSPATMTYYQCVAGGAVVCPPQRPGAVAKRIVWQSQAVELKKVVGSPQVRFGPFKIKQAIVALNPETYRHRFVVSVWARSPAIPNSAQHKGAKPGLVKIAQNSVTLSGNQEQEMFVDAVLPGVFTAFQLRASIQNSVGGVEISSKFPNLSKCEDLPSSAAEPEKLDEGCLQAAVNPLSVLKLAYLPLTILYEPPGNCSWSNLAQKHVAGTKIEARSSSTRSTRTITDSGFFWDAKHSDYESTMNSAEARSIELKLTNIDGISSRIGGSHENPGNPDCNVPSVTVPPRENAGPGQGDLFVLLKNSSLLYWGAGNLQSSTFSPVRPPGPEESILRVTAHQIRTGDPVIMPPLTPEERDAILALNPFNADGSVRGGRLDPTRFVQVGIPFQLGPGVAIEHTETSEQTSEGEQSITEELQNNTSSTSSDPAVDLTMKGIQFGASAAADAALAGALNAISPTDFADMAGKMKGISVPTLFVDQQQTNITITYGQSNLLKKADSHAVTQQFYLQDTLHGLSIVLYFDKLYGTYVFLPYTPGAGIPKDPLLQRLPVLAWTLDGADRTQRQHKIPEGLHSRLLSLGAARFDLAPAASYKVAKDRTKVDAGIRLQKDVASRLTFDQLTTTKGFGGRSQSLYVVRNRGGRPVAQLWIDAPL